MKVAGMESQSFNEQIKKFQERFIAGWAADPVVGTLRAGHRGTRPA